jgi:FixJ family two-component response regulator
MHHFSPPTNAKVNELQSRYQTLSERERTVMKFVVAGLLNKQTAGEMAVSEVTVKVHRHNLMTKLGAKSVPELVRIADISAPKDKDIRAGQHQNSLHGSMEC